MYVYVTVWLHMCCCILCVCYVDELWVDYIGCDICDDNYAYCVYDICM